MKLLQELFAQGYLSEEKVDEYSKQTVRFGKTEEEIILAKKIVTEDFLFNLKSKITNIPLKKVDADKVPSDILELIPEEASINYKMVAIERAENVIQIGMVYPEDMSAQNALRFLAGQQNFNFKIFLITITDLENLLKQRKNITGISTPVWEIFPVSDHIRRHIGCG